MEVFRGVVVYWNKERWFGMVRLFNAGSQSRSNRENESFFVRGDNIVPDEYGSRYLRMGEHVEFVEDTDPDPLENTRPRRADLPVKRRAKDVKAPTRAARPEGYTEDCVVTIIKSRWDTVPVCGFAKRPEGDTIFWHRNDIATEGEMHIGTKFNCVPEPNREGSTCWRAAHIEIYMPEQGDNTDGHESN
jgi:hypothetical protein